MIRQLAPTEYEAARELWNAVAEFDQLSPKLFAEKLTGDPDFDPRLALATMHDESLAGFATLVVRPTPRGSVGYVKFLAIAADRQREGRAGELLAAVERLAADRGASEMRIAESAPNYLTPGVDVRYGAACGFFEKHGYDLIGEACNLEVDLCNWNSAGDTPPAEGYALRRAGASDAPAIAELLQAHWPTWQGEVSVAMANDSPSLWLAIQGSKVIGFAAYDANNRGTGWFGPMGTDPAHERRGLGRGLLRSVLADMAREGFPRAIIPWVGPIEFYERHAGAQPSRSFVRFRKLL